MKSFTCGLIIGCAFTYITFQSHLIWTGDGLMFIPKLPATPLNDSFADIRDWNSTDWRKHPQLHSAIENANRLDLTQPVAAAPQTTGPTNSERAMHDFLNGAFQPATPHRVLPESRQQTSRPNRSRQQIPRDVPGPVRSWNDPRHPMSGPSAGQPVQPVYNRFQDELDRAYRKSRTRLPDAGEHATGATTAVSPAAAGLPATVGRPTGFTHSTATADRDRRERESRGS
ncbi:MAG: hypothetical protein ABGZ17_26740 [Planctomycetaceae bacterium]